MKWSPISAINSEAKVRLLAYLFSRVSAAMSATEIARLIDLAPMTVTRLLKELENSRVITIKRVGTSHTCSLNTKSYTCQALQPIFRSINFILAPLDHLKLTIKKTLPQRLVAQAYIYGSVARNESVADSDIDIIVVLKRAGDKAPIDKTLEDLNVKCLDLYGMRVEWIFVLKKDTVKQKFKDMLNDAIPIFS